MGSSGGSIGIWTPFDNLYNAASLDRVQDVERIAGLCARVLTESDLDALKEEFNGYSSRAAMVVLRALGAYQKIS